jgi:hypothetical protein
VPLGRRISNSKPSQSRNVGRYVMKTLKIIFTFLLVILTWFVGELFFFRLNFPYENGRYFNQTTLVVYKQQAVTVYLTLFIFLIIMMASIIFYFIRKSYKTK